jgi:hypothetical protein
MQDGFELINKERKYENKTRIVRVSADHDAGGSL